LASKQYVLKESKGLNPLLAKIDARKKKEKDAKKRSWMMPEEGSTVL